MRPSGYRNHSDRGYVRLQIDGDLGLGAHHVKHSESNISSIQNPRQNRNNLFNYLSYFINLLYFRCRITTYVPEEDDINYRIVHFYFMLILCGFSFFNE